MAKVKLAEEWTTKVQSMNWVQIQDEIASIAKDESENKKLKAEDPDLSLLKEQVKEASKQYTEASAMNKAKLEYAIEIQLTRGRPVQNPNGVAVKKEPEMSKVRRFKELATGEEWTLSDVVALTATLARKDETRNVTLVRLAVEYKEVEP